MLSGQYISALSSTMHIVCVYFFKENTLLLKCLLFCISSQRLGLVVLFFVVFFKAKFSGNIFENCMSRVMYTGTAKALLILLLLWLGGDKIFKMKKMLN